MSEVIVTDRLSIKVAVSTEIASLHLKFAAEIKDKMGGGAACRYLYHVYPEISLSNAKNIIEDYL